MNCDGMGSIAPHPAESPALRERIRTTLLDPLVRGLRADGLDFTGFIYLGAMITGSGLAVLEINARFGDSEAEAVLPGVCEDFTALCHAVLGGALGRRHLLTDDLVRCTVALTPGLSRPVGPRRPARLAVRARTAPASRSAGWSASSRPRRRVFYANVRKDARGRPVTCGGRVLHVVGCAPVARAGARERLPADRPHRVSRYAPPPRHRRQARGARRPLVTTTKESS